MVKGGRLARLGRSEVRVSLRLSVSGERIKVVEVGEFTLARKVARSVRVPVPQTDTGRR